MNSPDPTYASAYYGQKYEIQEAEDYLFFGSAEKRIEQLLLSRDPLLRERIERAVKQWNQSIREQLRNETGLRFTLEKRTVQIPVTVTDGLPKPLQPVLAEIEEWVLELLRHSNSLGPAIDLLSYVPKRWENVSAHLAKKNLPPNTSPEEIQRVRQLLIHLRQHLPIVEVRKKTREIKTDVLGAYFYLKPRIEIYWLAIGIYAELIDVPVEGLAVAVLIHELAHAYTHVGYDIDGQHWDTFSFGSADLNIVEGLAQFYTCVISERLGEKFPEAHRGYTGFLKLQSGPYLAHLVWAKPLTDICEVVRGALLETRSQRISEHDKFLKLLDQYHKQLKGRERPTVEPTQEESNQE